MAPVLGCAFPPLGILSCVFGRKLQCLEHWQRTAYPEQAEPGLGPKALAGVRGSGHGPPWERVSAEEGRFGADGAAGVALFFRDGKCARCAWSPGARRNGRRWEHTVPPADWEEEQGRRNFQGDLWKHQCREQPPVRTSTAACCGGMGAESCSPLATTHGPDPPHRRSAVGCPCPSWASRRVGHPRRSPGSPGARGQTASSSSEQRAAGNQEAFSFNFPSAPQKILFWGHV